MRAAIATLIAAALFLLEVLYPGAIVLMAVAGCLALVIWELGMALDELRDRSDR